MAPVSSKRGRTSSQGRRGGQKSTPPSHTSRRPQRRQRRHRESGRGRGQSMAKTHLVWGFPPPPKAQQRGRQRKEVAGVHPPSGSQGKARLLCRRGQGEREIGFEMGVSDSTRLAFLLPERTREMRESAQALAEGQEAKTGKTEAGGGESAVGKPEPLPVPSQGGQRLVNSQARLPRAQSRPGPSPARRCPSPFHPWGVSAPATRPVGGLAPAPGPTLSADAGLSLVACSALPSELLTTFATRDVHFHSALGPAEPSWVAPCFPASRTANGTHASGSGFLSKRSLVVSAPGQHPHPPSPGGRLWAATR